jgi:NADH:ubiquinone oxidoreductase subunit 6 (subunit J)
MVDLNDITFYAMVVVTIGGALTALEAREIIYGAIGLAFSFFGVAGLFFLLDAPFVAVFQITVYIGAVAVLILFTVMLVREGRWMRDSPGRVGKLAGILTACALGISLALAFLASKQLPSGEQSLPSGFSFVYIGRIISTTYAPVLEILALVLAASIVGAMMLAKVDREDKP